jgi:hypothetical protein
VWVKGDRQQNDVECPCCDQCVKRRREAARGDWNGAGEFDPQMFAVLAWFSNLRCERPGMHCLEVYIVCGGEGEGAPVDPCTGQTLSALQLTVLAECCLLVLLCCTASLYRLQILVLDEPLSGLDF